MARRDAELRQAADEFRETGSKVLALALDITAADSVPKLVGAANSEFGRIDVLVNNVGGTPPAKLEELSDADWHVGFETNFFTAVRLTSACAPDMAARGWGRIINIASINARQPDVYFAVYSAAKAALLELHRDPVELLLEERGFEHMCHPRDHPIRDGGQQHRVRCEQHRGSPSTRSSPQC